MIKIQQKIKKETRAKGHTKVNAIELELINRKICENRHLSAGNKRDSLGIQVSTRTVQKYTNLLGWSKVGKGQFDVKISNFYQLKKRRFCQSVTTKKQK